MVRAASSSYREFAVIHNPETDLVSQPPESTSISSEPDNPIPPGDGDLGNFFKDDELAIAAKRRVGVAWLVGSGLLVMVAFGGWFGYSRWFQPGDQAVSVVTAPTQTGDLEISITASGTVELGGQQTFTAPDDVTVGAVTVTERQRVDQGAVLVQLRNRRLQQELNDARVQLQVAQNDLERDRERIQEQQAKLDRAQNRLDESQALVDLGYISQEEYLRDQDTVEDALAALRDAQVEQENSALTLRNRQLAIETLQAQLADNQILAPFNAVVLKIEVNAGDGVPQGERLLTIGDPSEETVRLQLPTLNAEKVTPNLPARVRVLGPNPQVFEGYVARISPQAIAPDGNSSNSDQATIEAEVQLNAPSNALIPGSAVSVDIILDQRTDVITVPLNAIQQDAEQPYVWIKAADGTAEKRPVTIGLQGLESAEIIAGLAVDEPIIVSFPPDAVLTPGMPLGDADDSMPETP